MHVAICDDNGADRKQMERLLKRESDRRAASTGVLYVDSYGNAEALLSNPLLYDVFYVDMCHTPGVTAFDVVEKLSQKGSQAPVVLCCSEINYREQAFPENVFFLDKAINAAELSASIDRALELKAAAPAMIELRNEKSTIYVTEAEILYAVEKGRSVIVTLSDGRTQQVHTDVYNLYSQWAALHNTFLPPAGRFLLNCRHVQKLGFMSATMTDGKTFHLSRSSHSYVMLLMANIESENSSN